MPRPRDLPFLGPVLYTNYCRPVTPSSPVSWTSAVQEKETEDQGHTPWEWWVEVEVPWFSLLSSSDHHGTNEGSVSQVSAEHSRRTVSPQGGSDSAKGSFLSGERFSWSFQARPEVTLTGCCSWQTDRRGSQNTPFGQNAAWSQDK